MKPLLLIIILSSFIHAQTYLLSGGKDNVVQIVASKILAKAYKKAGLDMELLFLPLEKSLRFSNSGRTDGELARIEKIPSLYPNLKRIPVSLVTVEAIAFSKNRSLKINNWSDLRNYRVIIVKGTKFIEKGTKNIQKTSVVSFHEAFKRLDSAEADIVVVPKLAGLKVIYDHNYRDIKPISPPLQRLKLYHFVHKKNAHLIPILTPILQTMVDSGEISYMRDAYLISITRR